MKNMMLLSGIGLALGLLSAPADAQRHGGRPGDYVQDQVVRCESGDNRRSFCQADVRGGVELVRNLSRTQCVRGRNWGEDRGGIWVDGGCRGEFRVGFAGGRPGYGPGYGPGNGNGQSLVGRPFRCESDNGRTRQCRVDEQGGRATLVRQLSSSPCVAGRTWGQDQAGVWVSNGCRGEFVIEQRRGNGNRWGNRR